MIRFRSGLEVRIRKVVGVMTVIIIRTPDGSEKYVGLLGVPDGDETNDFTDSNRSALDVTRYKSVSERDTSIFYNFEKTWIVPNEKTPYSVNSLDLSISIIPLS